MTIEHALLYGAELDQLRGTATEIAGFLDACDEYGWEPVNAVLLTPHLREK